MSDLKTVKVDNWGSFFLQKLQNFFNKTDYCDLTLQFRDNSQLKVHRLVLSACTDFFNILESTGNCTDDILIMPRDLQADVVVPIVNFMYTGTLEFEIRMYERLLRTARDMKMSVLLKLLEAHRRAIPQAKPPPVVLNRGVGRPAMRGGGYIPPRGRPPGGMNSSLSLVSRLHQTGGGVKTNRMSGMSYESKPLMAEDDDEDDPTPSSDFERLRRSGNENPNKRPASIQMGTVSPPTKKPNLQDVKEYTEAARLRKQLNEGNDEPVAEYEADDTYDQSSGDDQQTPRQSISLLAPNRNSPKTQEATVIVPEKPGQKIDHAKIIQEVMKKYPHLLKSNKNIKLKITQKTPGVAGTQFTVLAETTTPTAQTPIAAAARPSGGSATKTTPPGPGQRVVLRAASAVPPNKSIVMKSNTPASATKASPVASTGATALPKGNRIDSRTMHRLIAMGAENTEGPWLCLRCGVDGKPIGIPTYKAFRKHLINTHHEKIDPRLCENCGHKSKNRNEMYYHMQTKHSIMPPQGFHFPVCQTCKFVAFDKIALIAHEKENGHGQSSVSTRSKAAAAAPKAPPKDPNDFSCGECDKSFMTRKALVMHQTRTHRLKSRGRQRKDPEETEEEEEEDEDIEEEEDEDEEADDDDDVVNDDEEYVPKSLEQTKKVNILSNVSLRNKTRSSEADALATVATGIATSLGVGEEEVCHEVVYNEDVYVDESETHYIEEAMATVHGEKAAETVVTKFLAEDGTELQLTDKQKEELMSQLESTQAANGGAIGDDVVMVYEAASDVAANPTAADGVKEDGEGSSILTDGDDVLMVYSGPVAKKGGKVADEMPEEQVVEEQIVEHEDITDRPATIEDIKVEEVLDDSKTEVDEGKVEDEKMKLIKELGGDWSEEKEGELTDKLKKEDITDTIMKDWEKTDEEDEEVDVKEEVVEKTDAKVDAKAGDSVVPANKEGKVSKAGASDVKTEQGKETAESIAAFVHDWDDEEN